MEKLIERAGGAAAAALIALAASVACAGCSKSGGGGSSASGSTTDILPADQRLLENGPGLTRTIEESDIFKLSGTTTLFVQNPTRGLSVLDVSNPDQPSVRAQLPGLVGTNGELYLAQGGAALFVVFKESATASGKAELVSVTNAATTPTAVATLDVAGVLVDSRLVGDVLYLVTSEAGVTRVTSVLVADPTHLVQVDQKTVSNDSASILVTDATIYVAETLQNDPVHSTRVQLFDISNASGTMTQRGSVDLRGFPEGRFHMDESGTMFRIVTFSSRDVGSNIYTIDVTDKDHPTIKGQLEGFAPGEDLHATHFVGDRAFVVTYKPVVITIVIEMYGGGDPVWVISLADPAHPTVIGELANIPGWSDYIFPRGNRLVAVGRGNLGAHVALSLFDVTNPAQPAELKRVEFGLAQASSQANTDFRGVSIFETGTFGATAMIAVPFTNNLTDSSGNHSAENGVQLVDLLPNDLELRGALAQVGLVRRTVAVGPRLYTVTDKTVASIDVTNRDAPATKAWVATGDLSAPDPFTPVFIDTPTIHEVVVGGCSIGPGAGSAAASLPLAACVALVALARRRTRYVK